MSSKVSRIIIRIQNDHYAVDYEFTSESIPLMVEYVKAMLPCLKQHSLPPLYIECPIHEVQMLLVNVDGNLWYRHKLSDGAWCHGGRFGS